MKFTKRWMAAVFVAALLVAPHTMARAEDEKVNAAADEKGKKKEAFLVPDKAVCAVCVAHGTGEGEEKVAAHTVYEGVNYYFCSKACKEEFEADPVAYTAKAFPRPAPKITVKDMDGKDVTLDHYRGKVVLLDFWATWCKPCIKALPDLEKLQTQYGDKGFTVLGVSIDENPKKVTQFVGSKKPSYPILLDTAEEPAWPAFHVKAIPATFLIDRDGQIVKQWTGAIDQKVIAAEVAALLAKGETKSD
jgi:peroxiredoxin/YHS domain-containing protein